MALRYLLIFVFFLMSWTPGAHAQMTLLSGAPAETTPVLPDPLTQEAANALISRLSDSEVRALLLDQLNTKAVTANEAENAGLSEFFYHATTGAAQSVAVPIVRLPQLFSSQAKVFSTFYERIGQGTGLLALLGYMVLVFGAGALAEIAFRRFTKNWRILPPADADDMQLREVVQLLVQRLTTQVASVVIFVIVSRAVGQVILPATFLPIVALIGPYLIGFPRLALAIAFFFMAPMNPEYRLLNVDRPTARAFCRHQFWLALLIGFSGAVTIFNDMHGLPIGEARLGFWLNLGMHIYLVWLIWTYRAGATSMMRGFHKDVSPMEDRIARAYPYFAIALIIAIWWVINIVVSYGNFELLGTAL